MQTKKLTYVDGTGTPEKNSAIKLLAEHNLNHYFRQYAVFYATNQKVVVVVDSSRYTIFTRATPWQSVQPHLLAKKDLREGLHVVHRHSRPEP